MATDEKYNAAIVDGRLVSEPALAARYHKTVRTLQRWRTEGYGPAHLRIGGSIFYRTEDIQAFELNMRRDGERA